MKWHRLMSIYEWWDLFGDLDMWDKCWNEIFNNDVVVTGEY